MRAVYKASISPASSIAESVLVGGIASRWIEGGRERANFSDRPGSSFSTVEIFGAGNRHAVLIAEDASNPDSRRHLIFRSPHAFSGKIFRLADSTIAVDVDTRMAEKPRGENRDCYERRVLGKKRENV